MRHNRLAGAAALVATLTASACSGPAEAADKTRARHDPDTRFRVVSPQIPSPPEVGEAAAPLPRRQPAAHSLADLLADHTWRRRTARRLARLFR